MAYEITLKPRDGSRSKRPVTLNIDGYYINTSGGQSSFSIGAITTEIPTDKIIKVREVKP